MEFLGIGWFWGLVCELEKLHFFFFFLLFLSFYCLWVERRVTDCVRESEKHTEKEREREMCTGWVAWLS